MRRWLAGSIRYCPGFEGTRAPNGLLMTSEAWKAQLREDLERTGERAVRDDMHNRGGLTTGGEERQQIIRQWIRMPNGNPEIVFFLTLHRENRRTTGFNCRLVHTRACRLPKHHTVQTAVEIGA
jgi:hypothetical protein